MRTEIKRVHQKVKTTTIYVTHDQVEAMTLADRVVVMNGGRIEQIGRPHELYHRPKTRFVAGFIGSPAMNFLPARLQPNGDGLLLRLAPELAFPVPPIHTARYLPSVGKDLVFGLRPEHITEPRAKFVRAMTQSLHIIQCVAPWLLSETRHAAAPSVNLRELLGVLRTCMSASPQRRTKLQTSG